MIVNNSNLNLSNKTNKANYFNNKDKIDVL